MRDLDPFDITVQKPQTFCAKEFCGAEISAVLTCFNRDLIQGMGLTSPKSAEAWEEDFGLSKACFFFFVASCASESVMLRGELTHRFFRSLWIDGHKNGP